MSQQADPTPPVPLLPSPAAQVQGQEVQAQLPTAEVVTNAAIITNRPVALRIVGSNVKNLKGEYLGRIENVVLNPETKQIEFALLDTSYPTNTGRVTPVPWNSLAYVWDQSQVGGIPGAVQLFRLDVDKSRLALAPSIDKTQALSLLQPQLRQELVAFYGNGSETPVGGVGAASSTTAGTGSGGTVGTTATTAATPGTTTTTTFPFGGVVQPDIGSFGTNLTNFVVTNNVATVTNLFPGGTNVFVGTNIFPGASTNVFFPTNTVAAGTNVFPGAPAPLGATNLLSPTGRTTVTRPTQPPRTMIPPGTPIPPTQSPFAPPSQIMVPGTPQTTPTPSPGNVQATTPTPIAPPATVAPQTPTPIAPPSR